MTVDAVADIMRDALFLIIKTAMPLLLVSLIVGLSVSIFQTVTSIQEQTLTFVPKIIVDDHRHGGICDSVMVYLQPVYARIAGDVYD